MTGHARHDELPLRVTVDPGVVWQEVEGQVVLFTLAGGRYYRLDEVGSRMWVLLDELADPAAAFERLAAEFEVDEAVLRVDLVALIGRLAGAGLLLADP